jgi:hypothetical protein
MGEDGKSSNSTPETAEQMRGMIRQSQTIEVKEKVWW